MSDYPLFLANPLPPGIEWPAQCSIFPPSLNSGGKALQGVALAQETAAGAASLPNILVSLRNFGFFPQISPCPEGLGQPFDP